MGKGRKRLTGDPVEAWQEEVHQKAKNAIDAAQEALWAHGPQSQECRDALRLADELVNINNALHGRIRGGPQDGGSASAMCPAAGSSDSTVGCAAGSSGSTMGCEAGSSGSAEGPGLASKEAEEKFSEIEVDEELEWFWPLAFVPIWVGSMCQFGIFHLGSWLTYEAAVVFYVFYCKPNLHWYPYAFFALFALVMRLLCTCCALFCTFYAFFNALVMHFLCIFMHFLCTFCALFMRFLCALKKCIKSVYTFF